MYLGSEEFHTIDIQRLSVGIFFSHEDFAFHTQEGCCRCGSHTVLSGTCLCDQAGLPHLLCQQCLSQGIIDLMGTGMVQILSLEIDLRAAQILRHFPCIVQQRGAPRVFIQQLVQLRIEFRILLIMLIALLQMDQFIHQCLGDILSSVDSVTSFAHVFVLFSFFLIFNYSFPLYFQSLLFRYRSTSSMIRRIFSGSFFRLLSMPELISNA